MERKQKQVIDSYQRVQTFLDEHPAPPPYDYSRPKLVLDEVVAQLGEHSSDQLYGRQLGQAERRRQDVLVRRLRDQHLRPIVTIARASFADQPGIEKALRMPRTGLTIVGLLAAASAIRDAATQYEPSFVKNGRPADFLEQLSAAIEGVRKSEDLHARNVGRRVGAKAGLAQELRRGRKAVEMLDAIVRAAFEGNDVALAAWRAARRVRGIPGPGAPEAGVILQEAS